MRGVTRDYVKVKCNDGRQTTTDGGQRLVTISHKNTLCLGELKCFKNEITKMVRFRIIGYDLYVDISMFIATTVPACTFNAS